jgi:hypothetical protein
MALFAACNIAAFAAIFLTALPECLVTCIHIGKRACFLKSKG